MYLIHPFLCNSHFSLGKVDLNIGYLFKKMAVDIFNILIVGYFHAVEGHSLGTRYKVHLDCTGVTW